jgi:hypothetical protein
MAPTGDDDVVPVGAFDVVVLVPTLNRGGPSVAVPHPGGGRCGNNQHEGEASATQATTLWRMWERNVVSTVR